MDVLAGIALRCVWVEAGRQRGQIRGGLTSGFGFVLWSRVEQ